MYTVLYKNITENPNLFCSKNRCEIGSLTVRCVNVLLSVFFFLWSELHSYDELARHFPRLVLTYLALTLAFSPSKLNSYSHCT